jgi:glycosyltransferase involved in cell wall biosynthesis
LLDPRDRQALRTGIRQARRVFGRAWWRTFGSVLASMRPTRLWRFLQAAWIAERAGRLGVTHFHAHFADQATLVARLAAAMTGRPYSFTAHASDIYCNTVDVRLLRRNIAAARFVATVSDSNLRYLTGVCGEDAAKLVLVRNGVDMTRFIANGLPSAPPFTMLSVARLVEKKGGRYLVEACRLLQERGVSFRCEIIGRGNLRQPLVEQIRRAGLERSVRLLGGRKQGDVLARLRTAHLYVLPSIVGSDGNREGLPVSIVEALACSLPVVSTPVTGIPEVVHDGHNGLLVPERDPVALADALQRLIEDRELYERLRAQARASVQATFDAAGISEQLRGLFVGRPA